MLRIHRCMHAKSLQSIVSNSVQPHRRQPTRLLRSWDSPGKNTGVGCHFLLQCMEMKSESEVAQSCPTLRNPTGSLYQRIVNPDADLSAWGEENETLTSSLKLLILCGCPRVGSWVMGFILLCRQAQGSAVSSHSEKT